MGRVRYGEPPLDEHYERPHPAVCVGCPTCLSGVLEVCVESVRGWHKKLPHEPHPARVEAWKAAGRPMKTRVEMDAVARHPDQRRLFA